MTPTPRPFTDADKRRHKSPLIREAVPGPSPLDLIIIDSTPVDRAAGVIDLVRQIERWCVEVRRLVPAKPRPQEAGLFNG